MCQRFADNTAKAMSLEPEEEKLIPFKGAARNLLSAIAHNAVGDKTVCLHLRHCVTLLTDEHDGTRVFNEDGSMENALRIDRDKLLVDPADGDGAMYAVSPRELLASNLLRESAKSCLVKILLLEVPNTRVIVRLDNHCCIVMAGVLESCGQPSF